MKKDFNYYARKFAKLNVNRNNGVNAPHKPILLLAVIELIEQRNIQTNQIYLSPELIATFLKYWSNLETIIGRLITVGLASMTATELLSLTIDSMKKLQWVQNQFESFMENSS